MRKQLKFSFFAVILTAILGITIGFYTIGYHYIKEENYNRFSEEGYLLANELKNQDMSNQKFLDDFVKEISGILNARISIINDNGMVLSDSQSSTKEDHRHRKEVKEAMKGKVGKDLRKSSTTGIASYYTAIKMRNQGKDYVIRIVMPQKNIQELVHRLLFMILGVCFICFCIATALSVILLKKVTKPVYDIAEKADQISGGDYDVRIPEVGSGHILMLSNSLNRMVENLRSNQKILELQNKELKEYEQLQAQFVSNVTHELKTPLTSIRGFVDTLREGAINDEKVAMHFLDIITIESNRLAQLIDDVLSLSEIEHSEKKPVSTCNVREVVKEVEEILRMRMRKQEQLLEQEGKEKSRVQFHVEVSDEIAEYPCDGAHLKEVILNLTDNALKYTKEGVVELTVFEWNHFLHIQVKDTGIGIAKEHLPRLFERFYRVDKGRSRKQGGTGLGLSIVKQIVDLYGGKIEVESHIGYGTTFHIYFPYDVPSKK